MWSTTRVAPFEPLVEPPFPLPPPAPAVACPADVEVAALAEAFPFEPLEDDAAAAAATITPTRSTTAASLRDGDQVFHTGVNLRDDLRRVRVQEGVFAQSWGVRHLLFAQGV